MEVPFVEDFTISFVFPREKHLWICNHHQILKLLLWIKMFQSWGTWWGMLCN